MTKNLGALLFFVIAMFVTAFFTPWWGTPIVLASVYVVFRFSLPTLIVVSFFAWSGAAAVRDHLAANGPARVIGKMLNLENIGFATNSTASRIIVYALAGIVGFLFATFTGGVLRAGFNLFRRQAAVAQRQDL